MPFLKITMPRNSGILQKYRSTFFPPSSSRALTIWQVLTTLNQVGITDIELTWRLWRVHRLGAGAFNNFCCSSTEPVGTFISSWHLLFPQMAHFSHRDILCWTPNHQAPANSATRKIPYLRLFKDRRDSTCSLLVSESLEDLLLLLSLELDGCDVTLGSSFFRGTAFVSKRLFLKARTELTFPREAGSPRRSLGFTYGGNLSFIRDCAPICLLFTRKLLSLRDKGLPPNGLATFSGWGLSLQGRFGLPDSRAASEEDMLMSEIFLLRDPVACLSWGLRW